MENLPLMLLRGRNVPADLRERFQNWLFEAYVPLFLKQPSLKMVDFYQIIKENPLYPELLGVYHHSNINAFEKIHENPDWIAIFNDMNKSFSRVEHVWGQNYHLLRSFVNVTHPVANDPKSVDTSIIHIEAFKLSPEEHERYKDWFVKWAYRVYIPVLMKLPGLKEYDHYQRLDVNHDVPSWNYIGKPVVTECPPFISIIYFENYENSPELISFKRAINLEVSNNLVPEWYIQYRLMRSWRK
jgi:hypothetical protein